MNIYEVKVCKFISMERKENSEGIYLLRRSDYVAHYCVVDFSNLMATDVYTYEQFRILQRNEEGRILGTENVELNQNYAVYFEKLNLDKLSSWELWRLKFACFKLNLLGMKNTKNLVKQKQNIIKR